MRILFINTGPWGTGSFTVIKGLTKELVQMGHKVKIFFPDSDFESIDKDEYYKNTELYTIWKFPIKNETVSIPTFPLMITDPHPRNPHSITFKELTDEQIDLYENELANKLTELVDTFKPDVIECHHIWYPSWVCNKLKLNYITVAHHSDQLGFRYDHRINGKALEAAKNAKAIFAISDSVKKEVMRLYHVDESKITVTYNGYDKNIFQKKEINKSELLKKMGIPSNAKIISFAGKLSRTKGIDTLMQANKLLDPKMNIHTLVMGAGELSDICNKMEVDSYSLKNMYFLGHQTPENLSILHNLADLSVMPSRSEGFGIACLEAMGCGLPMVVSRSGGPERFAVGRVINKGSPQELASAITEILNLSKNDYEKLSHKAQLTAEKFSWKKIAEEHLKKFQSISKEI